MGKQGTSQGNSSITLRIAQNFAPFAKRAFLILWTGQFVSFAGDSLTQIASVFAILRIGGTAADIGYVAAVQTLCRVVLVPVGGVWADRLRRQYVMMTSDLLRAAVQATLAVLLLTGTAHVWELGAGAAFYGIAQAFFGPASTGLLPETVDTEQIQAANSLMSFGEEFSRVGGPAIAGVLVAAFGPGLVFAVDAASFLVSAISLVKLKLGRRKIPARRSLRSDLATGWREMKVRPWYWLTLIAHALWNFAIPALWVLGPVIATRHLGGPSDWGAIVACWAVGSVTGGLVSLRVKLRRPLVAANLALALTALPVLALAQPQPTWVVGIAAAVGGVGLVFLNTVWISTMQQLIPDEVRSRVDAYDWLISLAVMPIGFAVIGPAASRFGTTAAMVGAAVLLSVPGCLTTLIPGIRAVRRTTEGTLVEPATPRSAEAVAG